VGKFIDLTGQRFGRWLVLERAPNNKWNQPCWFCFCTCNCDTFRIVTGGALTTETSTSCGRSRSAQLALHRGSQRKHGERPIGGATHEYRAWQNLRRRCNNPNASDYPGYGGRGISVSTRWDDYPTFLADVGRAPGREYTLDRINNNGNYEPGNVRWATRAQQAVNKRPKWGGLCRRGHVLDGIDPSTGRRSCLTCRRAAKRARNERRKQVP
jgi:hypothetical protein